ARRSDVRRRAVPRPRDLPADAGARHADRGGLPQAAVDPAVHAERRRGKLLVRVAARGRVADQVGADDRRAARLEGGVGKPLGVADVRRAAGGGAAVRLLLPLLLSLLLLVA